jgi:serine/threonine protein kinase
MDDHAPKRLPSAHRFQDRGQIALGGMGSVRRVYDTVLCREVAMKLSDPGDPAYGQTARRFTEEAQITGQLDHPNIVAVHDLGGGRDGEGIYFTMKLVEGETLTEYVARLHDSPYDQRFIERFLGIFLKICDALSFAHSRGVVHRDIKPDNVMVGSHGQVYLMDWGASLLGVPEARSETSPRPVIVSDSAAGSPRDGSDEAGDIVGTFEYMAPEQAWGRTAEIGPRTDVFGLGGILYHLLTRGGPNAAPSAFEAHQRAQRAQAEPPESRAAWAALPPQLCRITMKALAKDPAERQDGVTELRDQIEEFLHGGGWFDTLTFDPGTPIVTQGDAADAAYIITEGNCEVFKGAGSERVLLRRLGPGDVFGETAVLTGEPRTASVVAVDRVTVKVVTEDALERELGQKSWSGAFVRALAERFRDVDEKLSRAQGKSR